MRCRPGCAACCVHISISSPIPGMIKGKPAGVRCVNLSGENLCVLHGTDSYPKVCSNFTASPEMCGDTTDEAVRFLKNLEMLTS